MNQENYLHSLLRSDFGNYKFSRMSFGIKTGPGAFQQTKFGNFGDIENVIEIDGRSKEEHDETFFSMLQRARETNVRFNKNKVQIVLEQVKYLSNIFSYNQITPEFFFEMERQRKELKKGEDVA